MSLSEVVSLVHREAMAQSKSLIEWLECSDLVVLVTADRDVEFGRVDDLLSRLSVPDLAVNRVFFAAASELTGEVGAIAMHAPVDLGGSTPAVLPNYVSIGFDGGSSDPMGLAPLVQSRIDAGEMGTDSVVVCECAPSVTWGFALSVVDAVLRGGVRKVALLHRHPPDGDRGEVLPSSSNAGAGRDAVGRPPSVRFNDVRVGRSGGGLPPVDFVHGGFAGVVSSFQLQWPVPEPPQPPQAQSVKRLP